MLVSHRPSPPGPLDTRADSPMREKAHFAGDSAVNRNTVHGLPTPATDVPSSGFTAVNGDSQRTTSFRPDDSARDTAFRTGGNRLDQSTTYNHYAWRSDERREEEPVGRDEARGSPSNKRKRDESGPGESFEHGRNESLSSLGDRSPKRPMTVLNSGGIRSPDRTNPTRPYSLEREDLEQPSTGPYVR